MEAKRMKKIVFSKLGEDNAYCEVGNVHPQNKRFGGVCMNQKWGSGERSLHMLKGITNFKSLRKKLILPRQPSKRGHY
jgi:hypothetical protein